MLFLLVACNFSAAPPAGAGGGEKDAGSGDTGECDVGVWYVDADGDGVGVAAGAVQACTAPSGSVAANGDCDDANAAAYPGAEETCDGADNNCDGQVDEVGAVDGTIWYPDVDGDGFGADSPAIACAAPTGHIADGTDCDDAAALTFPGGEDVCGDGVDQNCDTMADEGCGPRGNVALADADWILTGDAVDDGVGRSLATGGDVDGDGIDDLVIAAGGDDDGGDNAGAAYVVRGPISASGALADVATTKFLGGNGPRTGFGTYVAFVGDLNGDGLDDVGTLSTYDYEVWWFLANATGSVAVTYATAGVYCGCSTVASSMAGAGDWDGDGLADIAVGNADGMRILDGAIIGAASSDGLANYTIAGAGWTYVKGLGDVTGDGRDDVILGSAGKGWIFPGGVGGALGSSAAIATFTGDASEGEGIFQPVGDLDGDGSVDLLASASSADDALVDVGRVYVLAGPFSGATVISSSFTETLVTITGTTYKGAVGTGSAIDGGLLLGAYGADSAYLFYPGEYTGEMTTDDAGAAVTGSDGSEAGYVVGGQSDLDADGHADVVVGAPSAGVTGTVYVVRGGR